MRAIAGERAGYAHASEISEAAIGRAAETVKAVHRGHGGRLDVARRRHQSHPLRRGESAAEAMPFDEKVKLLAEIDAYARAKDPRVRQVIASLLGQLAGGPDHAP